MVHLMNNGRQELLNKMLLLHFPGGWFSDALVGIQEGSGASSN